MITKYSPRQSLPVLQICIIMQTARFLGAIRQIKYATAAEEGLTGSSPCHCHSKLPTVSKVLEGLLLTLLSPHLLKVLQLSLPSCTRQSAYRKGHYIRMHCCKSWTLDGFYMATGYKQVNVIISFDLSAVFNTVDHETLLHVCRPSSL